MASSSNNSRNCPKYAVVHLPEGTNVLNFYQLLVKFSNLFVKIFEWIKQNLLSYVLVKRSR